LIQYPKRKKKKQEKKKIEAIFIKMAADALRISSSSSGSLVCNLNGSQRRPVLLPLSHRATFLGLPPRASSSSISSSIPQFLGTSRIGLGSSKLSHKKKFSVFAAAEGLCHLSLFFTYLSLFLTYKFEIYYLPSKCSSKCL